MLEGTDELQGWLKVGGGARSKGRAMKEGGIGLGFVVQTKVLTAILWKAAGGACNAPRARSKLLWNEKFDIATRRKVTGGLYRVYGPSAASRQVPRYQSR